MPRKTRQRKEVEVQPPSRRSCGTMPVHERLLRTVPGYREARDAIENHALRARMFPQAGRAGCTSIPVVVHVVYNTAAQNISDAQIESQIDVLTADFRRLNADVSTVPSVFAPLAADTRIEFALATTDPAGNPTNGITRTATTVSVFTDDDRIKSAATGGADPWPSDNYLNMWVAPRITSPQGDLLGYAQFPGGPAAADGVVILHSAFGTTGTAAAPFNLGRTATHEVGHWLNLRHIWGDDGTGCAGDDFVIDTPNQGGPNFGTPTFPNISCGNGPNGDMFMNYMDYVDDVAMVFFTTDQVTRMHATLDGIRGAIGTSISCGKPLPKDLAKEPPKDWPKDPPKEFPKDWPKEPIKEWVKELPKDPPKDTPKDPPKDIPKDGLKDPAFEPPKNIFDPPKSFLEPPINPPFGPVGQIPSGVQGTPFVLATGAVAGQGAQTTMRQQITALANAYMKLLAQYGRLYAAGQLDATGLTAWQETASEYQRLIAASGQP